MIHMILTKTIDITQHFDNVADILNNILRKIFSYKLPIKFGHKIYTVCSVSLLNFQSKPKNIF